MSPSESVERRSDYKALRPVLGNPEPIVPRFRSADLEVDIRCGLHQVSLDLGGKGFVVTRMRNNMKVLKAP
ncbi:MAG: hypothetical protein H7A21_07995 [Spirochaetales bacterium]|nr:hypothetical protein [Spirochaetales bacterium]MCP5486097.1 hypothetical protein [Spirochaetales bacterium]